MQPGAGEYQGIGQLTTAVVALVVANGSCIGMSVLTVTIGCVRVYRIARQSSSAFFMTRRHSGAAS